jgi:hypothetical protein
MEPILLNDRWRVGVTEPPQWALERRVSKTAWLAVSFCRTRSALLRAVLEKVQRGAAYYPAGGKNHAVDPLAAAQIEDFPPRIDETWRKTPI